MRTFCSGSKEGQACCGYFGNSKRCHEPAKFALDIGTGVLDFRCGLHGETLSSRWKPIREVLTPAEQIYRDDPEAWKEAQKRRK